MDHVTYHSVAEATLSSITEQLEPAYESGTLDEVEYDGSVLTITTGNGRTFVVSKHEPSRQIWLASPLSGGLHFDYFSANERWELRDGRTLLGTLMTELAQCGASVKL